MSELYTASRLRVWRQCHRAHYFRYALGAVTPSGPAQQWGTYAHGALEHWYRAWMLGFAGRDGKPDLRLVDALEYIDSIEDISEVDRTRLRVVIVAYDTRWGSEDWDVLAVEQQFRYFLGDIEIGGKLDALIKERSTGRVLVVEHKTSTQDTSPGSVYWERLTLDEQISIYIDGAAFGLDHDVQGCVYDVLKRPQHELKLATPEEARKYTLGKGCAKCGGSAGGKKGIVQGSGHYDVVFASEVKRNECDGCKGTGWKLDDEGQPQAPRLHANQRSEDETLEAYEERLVAEISERVDDYLSRGVIVRLDHELPRMRQELIDTIRSMEALDAAGLHSPNHDSCARGREMCAFFGVCSGRQSIDDFPKGGAHPELAQEPAAESQEAA